MGINGKVSELQAAMGLAVFPHLETILAERRRIVEFYDSRLDFSSLQKLKLRRQTEWNYSYYPVIFESERRLLEVLHTLNTNDIFPRRYFYPSLNTLPYVHGGSMPVSESIAARVLCLPLYVGLPEESRQRTVALINAK